MSTPIRSLNLMASCAFVRPRLANITVSGPREAW